MNASATISAIRRGERPPPEMLNGNADTLVPSLGFNVLARGIAGPRTADVQRAALDAAAAPIDYARRLAGGKLPAVNSHDFINAHVAIRRAVLLVLGEAWLVEDPRTIGLRLHDTDPIAPDYLDGVWHRVNTLVAVTQLQRRRWGPTGDRDHWIRHGNPADHIPPATPDPALERAFAAARAYQGARGGDVASPPITPSDAATSRWCSAPGCRGRPSVR